MPFLSAEVDEVYEEMKALLALIPSSPTRLLAADCHPLQDKEYVTPGHFFLSLGKSKVSIDSGTVFCIYRNDLPSEFTKDVIQIDINGIFFTIAREEFPIDGAPIVADEHKPTWGDGSDGSDSEGQ